MKYETKFDLDESVYFIETGTNKIKLGNVEKITISHRYPQCGPLIEYLIRTKKLNKLETVTENSVFKNSDDALSEVTRRIASEIEEREGEEQ